MAIRVAELARAGLTPDWMPGAVPRCVPVDIKRNRHGERAATVVVGTERVLTRGKWRTVEVLACPVTFSPHPQQIEAARRAYDDWWRALGWVREGLIAGGMLREVMIKVLQFYPAALGAIKSAAMNSLPQYNFALQNLPITINRTAMFYGANSTLGRKRTPGALMACHDQ
jgi:hypothetical protein